MAREIHIPYGVTGSADLYLRFRNASGQYRRGDTGAYESFNAANIALYGADAATVPPYHVATEDGSTGDYFADLPDATVRTWSAYLQAGAAPSADGSVDVEIAADQIGVNVTQLAGQPVNAVAAVTFPASIGTSTLDENIVSGIVQSELVSYGVGTSDLDATGAQAAAAAAIAAANLALEATLTAMKGAGWTTETMKAIKDAVPTAAANFAAVLRTQLTEGYAANGTVPTLEQLLFLIQQSLHEFAISGTTRTVKKLDGSTTAATFTLDDADAPTSTTRAS